MPSDDSSAAIPYGNLTPITITPMPGLGTMKDENYPTPPSLVEGEGYRERGHFHINR